MFLVLHNERAEHVKPWLLATRSEGKLRELSDMLAAAGVRAETLTGCGLEPQPEEDAIEVYDTFAANALAKARWFAEKTGRVVLADDSGLCVDALDGSPGVHSKRWSGRSDLSGLALDAENNRMLHRSLAQAALAGRRERSAHYCCAAACAWGDTGGVVTEGRCEGLIIDEARGSNGFGYDPYFVSTELGGRSFGEAGREEKAGVSHRGRAFRSLFLRLREIGVLDPFLDS